VTDMRRGYASLSGLVQTSFDKSPFSGNVFIFVSVFLRPPRQFVFPRSSLNSA
jgi:hypothetical protein